VPINQEDLLVTQLAFSQLVMVALERMGIGASRRDMESFLHLWRYIGHLMGVCAPLGDMLEDLDRAEAALESIMLHLVEPDASSSHIAANVLESVAVHRCTHSPLPTLSAVQPDVRLKPPDPPHTKHPCAETQPAPHAARPSTRWSTWRP
jgi:hypothetical protein